MSEHIDYEVERDKRLWWLNNTGGKASDNLTVRDYFAAKAMAAMVNKIPLNVHIDAEGLVENAYKYADLMMKERAK